MIRPRTDALRACQLHMTETGVTDHVPAQGECSSRPRLPTHSELAETGTPRIGLPSVGAAGGGASEEREAPDGGR
jgi:hypothetical protein